MWVFLSLKPHYTNILHSAFFRCQKGIIVVFVPHTMFLNSKDVFGTNFDLVWLSVTEGQEGHM